MCSAIQMRKKSYPGFHDEVSLIVIDDSDNQEGNACMTTSMTCNGDIIDARNGIVIDTSSITLDYRPYYCNPPEIWPVLALSISDHIEMRLQELEEEIHQLVTSPTAPSFIVARVLPLVMESSLGTCPAFVSPLATLIGEYLEPVVLAAPSQPNDVIAAIAAAQEKKKNKKAKPKPTRSSDDDYDDQGDRLYLPGRHPDAPLTCATLGDLYPEIGESCTAAIQELIGGDGWPQQYGD
jgi:hypothetical protein